jgi:glycerophosphoryl diester phosphodiesterase
MPLKIKNFREKPVTLIQHAANCNHNGPLGSISALQKSLSDQVSVIEIDVIPLGDGSFALLHDPDLEADTNGIGSAPRMNREQIENLIYVRDGIKTGEKVGFLEDAISLLETYPATRRLQLDLKPFSPLPTSVLRNLLSIIEKFIDRVQVSSYADWMVRGLSSLSPDLSLGFDPLLYLDIREDEPRPENTPPFRLGAYGLLDDHPLSAYQWGPPGDYFAARAESLLAQVPQGCEWFIRAEILKMALDAGFDWIDFLHRQGSKVDGWTIDVTLPEQLELAQFLVDHKIDDLTTDHPAILATHLKAEAIL